MPELGEIISNLTHEISLNLPHTQGLVTFIIIAGLTLLVALIAGLVLRRWALPVVRRTETSLDDLILGVLGKPVVVGILVVGLQVALGTSGILSFVSPQLLGTAFFFAYWILIFVNLYRLLNVVEKWYLRDIEPRVETPVGLQLVRFLRMIGVALIVLLALVTLLEHFGVSGAALNSVLAAAGLSGLALSLAAQETLKDLISGVIIMVDQPFRLGDRIDVEELNTWGDVTEIGWRSTRIMTRDHRMISVPNSRIGAGVIVNHSFPATEFRVQTHVTVAGDADIARTREVLVNAVKTQDWVMQNRPVEALLLELADAGLMFRVRCWIESYEETRRVVDKLNTAVAGALTEAGIEMPYPQLDVHIREGRPHIPESGGA